MDEHIGDPPPITGKPIRVWDAELFALAAELRKSMYPRGCECGCEC